MSLLILAEQDGCGLEFHDEIDGRDRVRVLKNYPADEYDRLVIVDLEESIVVEYKRTDPQWTLKS